MRKIPVEAIEQAMLPFLSNQHLKQLHTVLEVVLSQYDMQPKESPMPLNGLEPSNQSLANRFLSGNVQFLAHFDSGIASR